MNYIRFINSIAELTDIFDNKCKNSVAEFFEYLHYASSKKRRPTKRKAIVYENKKILILTGMGFISRNIDGVKSSALTAQFTIDIFRFFKMCDERTVVTKCDTPLSDAFTYVNVKKMFGNDIGAHILSFITRDKYISGPRADDFIHMMKLPRIVRVSLRNYDSAVKDNINDIADFYYSRYGESIPNGNYPCDGTHLIEFLSCKFNIDFNVIADHINNLKRRVAVR